MLVLAVAPAGPGQIPATFLA